MSDDDQNALLDFGESFDNGSLDEDDTKHRLRYLDLSKLNDKRSGHSNIYRTVGPCFKDDLEIVTSDFYKTGSLEPLDVDDNEEGALNQGFENEETSEEFINSSLLSYFASLATDETSDFNFDYVSNLLNIAEINSTDCHGQTLMHEIAREWNTDIAQYLYDKGLHIDVADNYGRTPLMVAAASDNTDMIDWLLKKNANLKAVESNSYEKRQAIHFAAMFDALEAFKFLVENGANPDEMDALNQTPLFIAARSGSKKVCSYLLELEVPVATFTKHGSTPIEQIVSNMPLDIAVRGLDQFMEISKQKRTVKYYLCSLGKQIWRSLSKVKGIVTDHLIYPTVIETIIRKRDYQLIIHPVILQYIDQCSTSYGNKYVYCNAALSILYTLIWTADVSLYSVYKIKNNIQSKEKVPTAILTALGFLMTLFFVFVLYRDYRAKSERMKTLAYHRGQNIQHRIDTAHPRWSGEIGMLKNEKATNEKEGLAFWSDYWVIIHVGTLLMAFVHIALNIFLLSGGESKAILLGHLYYSVFFLFACWIRMNRDLLFLESLGAFINMLALSIKSVFQFGFLFLTFYIPFNCTVWVLFGGNRKEVDGSDSYLDFQGVMYNVFLLTFVGDYDLDTLKMVDKVLAAVVVGVYMIIVSVICLNLYVALLSESFMRVYGDARAMSLLSKAEVMLSLEISQPQLNYQKETHLFKKCAPLTLPLSVGDDNETLKTKAIKLKKEILTLGNNVKRVNRDQNTMFKNIGKCNEEYKNFDKEYGETISTTELESLHTEVSTTWYKAKAYSDVAIPVALSRFKEIWSSWRK